MQPKQPAKFYKLNFHIHGYMHDFLKWNVYKLPFLQNIDIPQKR